MGAQREKQFRPKPLMALGPSDTRGLEDRNHRKQLLELARLALFELDVLDGRRRGKGASLYTRYSKKQELDEVFARLSGAQQQETEATGPVLRLDPSDPHHHNHPSHDEQWLEFAREIGRMMAIVGGDGLLFQESTKKRGEQENLRPRGRRKRMGGHSGSALQ